MEIIHTIAPHWRHLGYLLDFDNMGRTVDLIAREHPLNPVDCCAAMLIEWLKGRGSQPTTWATLIKLLKDADINDLAQDLEEMLLPVRDEGKAGEEVEQMKREAERGSGGQRGRGQE